MYVLVYDSKGERFEVVKRDESIFDYNKQYQELYFLLVENQSLTTKKIIKHYFKKHKKDIQKHGKPVRKIIKDSTISLLNTLYENEFIGKTEFEGVESWFDKDLMIYYE